MPRNITSTSVNSKESFQLARGHVRRAQTAHLRRAESGRVGGEVVGQPLGLPLGRDPGEVVVDLAGAGARVPAEYLAHQLGDVRGAPGTPVLGLDGDAGTPGQRVLQVQRALVP